MTKDPDHKNRCRVLFPEVFSTFPYKVNVTAINALGTAHTTIFFEESTIGELNLYRWFLPENSLRHTQEGRVCLKTSYRSATVQYDYGAIHSGLRYGARQLMNPQTEPLFSFAWYKRGRTETC